MRLVHCNVVLLVIPINTQSEEVKTNGTGLTQYRRNSMEDRCIYSPKLPAAPGYTTTLSTPSLLTLATPKK